MSADYRKWRAQDVRYTMAVMLARVLLLPATLAAAAAEASFSPVCHLAGNWTDGTCVRAPVSARCRAWRGGARSCSCPARALR